MASIVYSFGGDTSKTLADYLSKITAELPNTFTEIMPGVGYHTGGFYWDTTDSYTAAIYEGDSYSGADRTAAYAGEWTFVASDDNYFGFTGNSHTGAFYGAASSLTFGGITAGTGKNGDKFKVENDVDANGLGSISFQGLNLTTAQTEALLTELLSGETDLLEGILETEFLPLVFGATDLSQVSLDELIQEGYAFEADEADAYINADLLGAGTLDELLAA